MAMVTVIMRIMVMISYGDHNIDHDCDGSEDWNCDNEVDININIMIIIIMIE